MLFETFFAKLSPKSIALTTEFLVTPVTFCPVLSPPPKLRVLKPKMELAENKLNDAD